MRGGRGQRFTDEGGGLTLLPAAARTFIRAASAVAARPVESSVAPIHEFIDSPPRAPLTAIDRRKKLPLTLESLDPANAERLAEATRSLLAALPPAATSAMRMGDNYRISAISVKDSLAVARRLSLDLDGAEQRVFEVGNGLVGAFTEAEEGVASPFAPKIVQAISMLAEQRGLPTN